MYLMVALLIIVIVLIYNLVDKQRNKKVENSSIKIKEIKSLNENIHFSPIKTKITISKHYDNKWSYNKIEPGDLLNAELRSKMDNYAKCFQIINENRDKKIIYDQKLNEILNKKYDIDYECLGISQGQFEQRENNLIQKILLFDKYTDLNIIVLMSYSSPKGRVNLHKSQLFNLHEIETCFNSISRAWLDRETYLKLANVERGEVSDSLRYDIMHRDRFRCVLCGASANDGVKLHIDHIVPISKGGKSTPDNLRTLCERCNIGKSNKIEKVNCLISDTPNRF